MIVAQLINLAHGLAAALISIAAFSAMGALLLPRKWQSPTQWSDNIVFGLAIYVVLCWVATSSRHIPVIYVMALLGAAIWGLAALRFRRLQIPFGDNSRNPQIRRWIAAFSGFYVFAYVLIRPSAASVLALPSDGALNLVTHARYATHVLTFGTANVDLAAFEYLHSPASAFLLAWHSLFFVADPLDAAMPLIFLLVALLGMIAADLARSTFGLSWRAAMTIGVITVCAPMCRWTLATYSLGELLSAISVLYVGTVVGRVVATRSFSPALFLGTVAGVALLFFSAWQPLGSPSGITRAVVDAGRHFPPLAFVGLPGRIPSAIEAPDSLASAALVILPLVPLVWATAVRAFRRHSVFDRIEMSAVDRRLFSALTVYVAVAVVVGNVAVHAAQRIETVRSPVAWRGLRVIGKMSFKTFTLRVSDEADGLSTALAMYYMPGKKAHVFGRTVALDKLPFENVSRHEPMFIQHLRCEAVGHTDTVSAPGIGCLLMAPPSMTVGTSYPLNQTLLFLDFDRMTSREPGGRWNTESTLNLRFTVDPQRASLDRTSYINFLVNPFLPADANPLRLGLRWGAGHLGAVVVKERQWFSVPVESRDWSGNRLWTTPVGIDFPDSRTILFHEVALTESPRGEVAEIIKAAR